MAAGVFNELFLMLHGYTAQPASTAAGCSVFVADGLSALATSYVSESDAQLLNQLADIGAYRARIRSFTTSHGLLSLLGSSSSGEVGTSGSRYLCALADALEQAVQDTYGRQLSRLQAHVQRDPSLGVLHLHSSLLLAGRLLRDVCALLDAVEGEAAPGCQLSGLLHAHASAAHGTLKEVEWRLLRAVNGCLCSQLACWLAHGRLPDSHTHEFFIAETSPGASTPEPSALKHHIRDDYCPPFFGASARENFLLAGHFASLVADGQDADASAAGQSELLQLLCPDQQLISPASVDALAARCRQQAGSRLWRWLLPSAGGLPSLLHQLDLLKHVLLLASGPLWSAFLHQAAAILQAPVAAGSQAYVHKCFDEAVCSAFEHDDQRCDAILQQFSLTIAAAPSSATASEGTGSPHPQQQPVPLVCNALRIRLQWSEPATKELEPARSMDLLLWPGSAECQQLCSLWAFLLRVAAAARLLNTLWLDMHTEPAWASLPRAQLQRVTRARMCLCHFVHALQEYLLIDVVDANWLHMIHQLSTCSSFDRAQAVVRECVQCLLVESCLTQPVLRSAFDALLNAVDKLTVLLHVSADQEGQADIIAAAHQAFVVVQPKLQYCIGLLRKTTAKHSGSAVSRLLLRLE